MKKLIVIAMVILTACGSVRDTTNASETFFGEACQMLVAGYSTDAVLVAVHAGLLNAADYPRVSLAQATSDEALLADIDGMIVRLADVCVH